MEASRDASCAAGRPFVFNHSSLIAWRSLAAYPPWIVFFCTAVVTVFLLWLAGRLLARTLELLPVAALLLAGVALVWWLMR